MRFELFEAIVTKAGKPLTWIEAGTYPVIRFFSKDSVLIDTGTNGKRQLSVVSLSKGSLIVNGKK